VEDAALNGLQAILDLGQGACPDHAHGVGEVGAFGISIQR